MISDILRNIQRVDSDPGRRETRRVKAQAKCLDPFLPKEIKLKCVLYQFKIHKTFCIYFQFVFLKHFQTF